MLLDATALLGSDSSPPLHRTLTMANGEVVVVAALIGDTGEAGTGNCFAERLLSFIDALVRGLTSGGVLTGDLERAAAFSEWKLGLRVRGDGNGGTDLHGER